MDASLSSVADEFNRLALRYSAYSCVRPTTEWCGSEKLSWPSLSFMKPPSDCLRPNRLISTLRTSLPTHESGSHTFRPLYAGFGNMVLVDTRATWRWARLAMR
jgi:hypothetical protein